MREAGHGGAGAGAGTGTSPEPCPGSALIPRLFSNNMLYPKEDKESRVLLYAVRPHGSGTSHGPSTAPSRVPQSWARAVIL